MTLPRAILALALAAGTLLGSPAASGDDFAEEEARYRAYLRRPSLDIRTRGRERFARTAEERALALLIGEYSRVANPRDHERYLLASICAEHFRHAAVAPRFRQWRAVHAKPADAWLWREALGAEIAAGEPEAAIQACSAAPGPFLRAAALLALAESGAADAVTEAGRVLASLPADGGPESGLLVETCAACLSATSAARRGSEEFERALRAVIARLDGELPDRSKLVVARYLARILDCGIVALDAKYWRDRLAYEADRARPPDDRYARAKAPDYFGIEGSGSRFLYVIDLSDTMLEPLTDAERGKLRGPVTGLPSKEARPEDLLPWDRIRTRFDAAREFTKLSLRLLPASARFSVVVFGSEARALEGAARLSPATKAAVAAACRALDGVRAGPASRDCPRGSLLGYTNLHGGLRLAYRITDRGVLGESEYVDPSGRERGADTIFLLSDGAPTWDDWGPTPDLREPEDAVGHPESGVLDAPGDTVEYCGPYWQPRHLVRDLRRLNLFRHAEIHCIGLGEASESLLREIASVGLGKVRILGKEGE